MPIQTALNPEQTATQALFDHRVLRVIRSGDAAAAQALSAMSLTFAAAQSNEEARVFWQVAAAYFETIAQGLCPLTVAVKRTTGQVLLQYRALQSGRRNGLTLVVQAMLFYCAQAEQPVTVDAAQFRVIGELHIGVAAFNIFLNEADEWSRHLVTELSEWSLALNRPVLDNALVWAQALSIRSADVGFVALADLAAALLKALQHRQACIPCAPDQAQVFVQAAEEIRRLLHQFAAGFLKTPDAQLLASLQRAVQACPCPPPHPA